MTGTLCRSPPRFFACSGHLVDMARTGHVDSGHMDLEVRYCELDGRRIAYATVGEGPTLLFGGRWVSHLEEDWSDPDVRSFFEDLALTHRVVRYDRVGVGLSDRDGHGVPDVEQLRAVLDASGGGPAALFACSCAGL